MKVIYDENLECVFLRQGVTIDDLSIVNFVPIPTFGIDSNIPLNIATKLFQRWHQIDQTSEPEFIARALDDALNCELKLIVRSTHLGFDNHNFSVNLRLYVGSKFNNEFNTLEITDYVTKALKLIGHSLVTVRHNITLDRVDYFIGGKLKGWLPIVRKVTNE